MVQVKPFKGLLYNQDKIKDIKSVVAPPYDVISEQEQVKLYQSSPHNIVRLVLGKELKRDSSFNNRYIRSANYLNNWLKKNILVPDGQDAFYIYVQKYTYQRKKITRYGLIALMRLEEKKSGKVLPHEITSSKPKEDRSKLLEAVRANLSPIFVLFPDDKKRVTRLLISRTKPKPLFDFSAQGIRQRLWRLSDKKTINQIQKLFKPKSIFIADGHHRYEVAVSFKHIYNYLMVYLVGLNDQGLSILPTHRLVKLPSRIGSEELLARLNKFFEVQKVSGSSGMFRETGKQNRQITFGLFLGGKNYFILKLKKLVKFDKNNPILDNLDVTILHNLIFKKIIKIESAKFNSKVISYTREVALALKLVNAHKYDLALFLNPTKLRQVRDIALARLKMPHKSTYFYPKPLSGLVINKF